MRQFLKERDISQSYYGSESLLSSAPKIWELAPDSIREVKTLSIFKNKISPCRLCKNYIGQVGFIYKAVPITFIAIKSSFSILGHEKLLKLYALHILFI